MRNVLLAFITCHILVIAPLPCPAAETGSDGWTPQGFREEIRPDFAHLPHGGPDGTSGYQITADERKGLSGYWAKTYAIEGGQHYRFEALSRAANVPHANRSVLAKITWLDAEDQLLRTETDRVRPEFPRDQAIDDGWTTMAGTYWVPDGATKAVVELHLRWVANASVVWSNVTLEPVDASPARKVRLAAVHFRPRDGKTAEDNRRMYEPLIAEAAAQGADLVCLGESITAVGNGLSPEEVAEPVPGPSTEYFGSLAKRHDLYIVVGLLEREGHLVYNVAALIGPDGRLAGKYRKVCLPREEIEKGITPGDEYPVFDTRFGRLGMFVCWDVHFPEVARELSNRGAEVLALPIWGGNPLLARARAVENQVYVVTSTFSSREDWMRSGVIDPHGDWIALAEEFGEVVVAEVDLDEQVNWDFLGDFRARIPRERPAD